MTTESFIERQPPLEYYYATQTANLSLLEEIGKEITHFVPSGMCAVATGSHGKLESYRVSRLEIILIAKSEDLLSRHHLLALHDFIVQNPELLELGISDKVDVKALDDEIPFSYVNKNPRIVYPDRLLNSHFLVGDHHIYEQARQRVYNEIRMSNNRGKRIRRYMRSQAKSYRQACRTGFYRKQQVFDVENGIAYYYEGSEDYRFNRLGLKLGFLRLVQRRLDLLSSKVPVDVPISHIPTTTLERMSFFENLGLLSTDKLHHEAYAYFLMKYHQLQKNFESDPTKVSSVQLDPVELREMRDIILTV